jgi:hypothetical protein
LKKKKFKKILEELIHNSSSWSSSARSPQTTQFNIPNNPSNFDLKASMPVPFRVTTTKGNQ